MASAPGIMLTATAISFSNDWYNHPGSLPNVRILAAGGLFSLMLAGFAEVNNKAAVGLASIAMITVLLTPVHGSSPVGTLAGLPVAKPSRG